MNARALAVAALENWRRDHVFADTVLQKLRAQNELARVDRAFATELFYGVLRNLSLLDFWVSLLRDGKIDETTRDLLRLGVYQIAILETPVHAAVFETVALASKRTHGLVNAVLRSADRRRNELQERAKKQPTHILFSHPEFLVAKWTKQFGTEATLALCSWNNQPAPVYARINELKITPAEFSAAYPERTALPNESCFVRLADPRAALERGHCYIQDPSTLAACDLLDAQPGEAILDACAAPGGKTAYIAQRMQNRGELIACDRDPDRLAVLRENLNRLGVNNARIEQRDWLHEKSGEKFDRILADVPCSNTGVLRRRVDLRWRLRARDFAKMQNLQLAIIRALVPLLNPGGVFVYSTCSIEPEENEIVVAQLTQEFPFLEQIEKKTMLPFRDEVDGAFAAKFISRH